MSPALLWTLVVGGAQAVGVAVAARWVNRRIRANRRVTRREQVAWLVPLTLNLLLFWYLCLSL